MTFGRIANIFYFAQPVLTKDSIEIFFKIKATEDSKLDELNMETEQNKFCMIIKTT